MKLTAYIGGARVGWFEQLKGGAIVLEYDRAWQDRRTTIELSLSLPKSRRRHEGVEPVNYLRNLLPDNNDVLVRWGRQFGVSASNPMKLLAHVGVDTAGAVQLIDSDECNEPELFGDGGIDIIGDAGVAERLRRLRADPSAWTPADQDGGHFSLAGAQPKFTLTKTRGGWGIPTGRTASTHIVKPGVSGLALSDLNEHLTMRAAQLLGLVVSESKLMRFEDQTAIIIARYDRRRVGAGARAGEVVRVHQEDLAQATGTSPTNKYQSEGGPGIANIGAFMKGELGADAERHVTRFFDATLFNWAALATDAHAKNYALLYGVWRGVRAGLAPLYDLGSVLAYPDLNNRKAKLAMSYGGHYRASEIEPRHIVAEALQLGISEEHVVDKARELTVGLPDALSQAAMEVKDLGLDRRQADFASTLVDRAGERSAMLMKQLV